jgi:hypothetical protein
VNASNVAPDENFAHILATSIASLGEFCAKNSKNHVRGSKLFLKISFPSFFCWTGFDVRKLS